MISVIQMQYQEKPEIIVVQGEAAIDTLKNYILGLKEGSADELTEEQTKAMIKIAKGLIQSIENGVPTREGPRKALLLPKMTEIHACARIWGYL